MYFYLSLPGIVGAIYPKRISEPPTTFSTTICTFHLSLETFTKPVHFIIVQTWCKTSRQTWVIPHNHFFKGEDKLILLCHHCQTHIFAGFYAFKYCHVFLWISISIITFKKISISILLKGITKILIGKLTFEWLSLCMYTEAYSQWQSVAVCGSLWHY